MKGKARLKVEQMRAEKIDFALLLVLFSKDTHLKCPESLLNSGYLPTPQCHKSESFGQNWGWGGKINSWFGTFAKSICCRRRFDFLWMLKFSRTELQIFAGRVTWKGILCAFQKKFFLFSVIHNLKGKYDDKRLSGKCFVLLYFLVILYLLSGWLKQNWGNVQGGFR